MKKPYDRPIFLRSVKALVRVTLSDSFRIRPPRIYKTWHDLVLKTGVFNTRIFSGFVYPGGR